MAIQGCTSDNFRIGGLRTVTCKVLQALEIKRHQADFHRSANDRSRRQSETERQTYKEAHTLRRARTSSMFTQWLGLIKSLLSTHMLVTGSLAVWSKTGRKNRRVGPHYPKIGQPLMKMPIGRRELVVLASRKQNRHLTSQLRHDPSKAATPPMIRSARTSTHRSIFSRVARWVFPKILQKDSNRSPSGGEVQPGEPRQMARAPVRGSDQVASPRLQMCLQRANKKGPEEGRRYASKEAICW